MLTLIKTKRIGKRNIPRSILQIRTLCFSSYQNRKLTKNCDGLELKKEKKYDFLAVCFQPSEIFLSNNYLLKSHILYTFIY